MTFARGEESSRTKGERQGGRGRGVLTNQLVQGSFRVQQVAACYEPKVWRMQLHVTGRDQIISLSP